MSNACSHFSDNVRFLEALKLGVAAMAATPGPPVLSGQTYGLLQHSEFGEREPVKRRSGHIKATKRVVPKAERRRKRKAQKQARKKQRG